MAKMRRGEITGVRQGPPASEAEHFMKCGTCGGYFDMRDLGAVCEHEGPLPHPSQDLPDEYDAGCPASAEVIVFSEHTNNH